MINERGPKIFIAFIVLFIAQACTNPPIATDATDPGIIGNGLNPNSKNGNPADSDNTGLSLQTGQRILQKSLAWVGRDFNVGATAQCANFVRKILTEACSEDFASNSNHAVQSAHPWDSALVLKKMGNSFGPSYADSLAGDDIGIRVSLSDLQAGDLVFFERTYGSYGAGVITHVGIYAENGTMVDRSTASAPVAKRPFSTSLFYAGLRIKQTLCK